MKHIILIYNIIHFLIIIYKENIITSFIHIFSDLKNQKNHNFNNINKIIISIIITEHFI